MNKKTNNIDLEPGLMDYLIKSNAIIMEYVENLGTNPEDELTKEDGKMLLDLLEKSNNQDYVTIMIFSRLLKEVFPKAIKKMYLGKIERDYKGNSKAEDYDRIIDSIKPVRSAIQVLGIMDAIYTVKLPKPDEEVKILLESLEFPTMATEADLVNFQNKMCKRLKNEDVKLRAVRNNLTIYFINNVYNGNFQADFARRFGKELGIMTNDNLIDLAEYYKSSKDKRTNDSEKYVIPFIDQQELMDKLENNNISNLEKKYINPRSRVYRFLENYLSEKNNVDTILEKVKIKDVINMFKEYKINFEDLLILLTKSSLAHCNNKEKQELKLLIKNMIFKNSNKETENPQHQIFAFPDTLELAKVGLISDRDILEVYDCQESMIEKTCKLSNISREECLAENNFISSEKMKQFFDAKKLLDNYCIDRETKLKNFGAIAHLARRILSPQEIEAQVLVDDRLENFDYIIFHYLEFLSDSNFSTLLKTKEGLKEELFGQLSRMDSIGVILNYFNNNILTEDDFIEIFDDNYESILRKAFQDKKIAINKVDELSYLDSSIIMDEYNKSIEYRTEKNEESKNKINLDDMIDIYLTSKNDLVTFENLYQIVAEKKEPALLDENFCLSLYLAERLKSNSNGIDRKQLLHKIKELYMNSFLNYDELNMLAEEGCIEYSEANKINNDFCNSKKFEELRAVKLGDSDTKIYNENLGNHKSHSSVSTKNRNNLPSDKQILQAETMIKLLDSFGFKPKTTTNQYGVEKIDTFDSGDFKDYRVFLSEDIPSVVVLMHCKQVPNTDTYYQVGGNATYIMSTPSFFNYLYTSGKIDGALASLNTTKSSAKESKYTRTANVGKNWGKNVCKKISQIVDMFEEPKLQEAKQANEEVEYILPDSLDAKARNERLSIIESCMKELEEIRDLSE